MKRDRTSLLICLLLLVSALACSAETAGLDGAFEQSEEMFGDQGFKTAVALIELHRIRYGEYPESLSQLQFTGTWDILYMQGISYERLENGYELNVGGGLPGSSTEPELCYPDEFWQGLGIVETNVGRCNP